MAAIVLARLRDERVGGGGGRRGIWARPSGRMPVEWELVLRRAGSNRNTQPRLSGQGRREMG